MIPPGRRLLFPQGTGPPSTYEERRVLTPPVGPPLVPSGHMPVEGGCHPIRAPAAACGQRRGAAAGRLQPHVARSNGLGLGPRGPHE
jgi:hypothetical protein